MTNIKPTQDRFASNEYVDTNARRPRINALRGENGASECGYFVSIDEMAKANWIDFNEKDLITYEFNSGGKEQGLLFQNPRMLVVVRSPLFAFDRLASRQEERLSVSGVYNKQLHADRSLFGTAQVYEVVLLDTDNQPLHEIGFSYLAKGANQASFSHHWQQLVSEVTRCHAIANSIPARPKDVRFQALCVFDFTVKRELAGTTAKSPACKVHSHTSPAQANWESFFLGRNDEVADRFLDLLCPSSKLALPESSALALPAADDSENLGEFA